MRLLETISWGAFLLAGIADARPANKKKDDECTTKQTCKKIKNVLGYKAIPACSAYLGSRTKTITVTKTTTQTARKTTQLPRQTKSATIERTSTILRTSVESLYSDDPTATVYETTQTGVASTSTTYVYVPPQKRSVPTVNPVLRDMEKRHPKKFVSEACSCVYKPTTKTVTRTAKVTKYVTKTTTKPAPAAVTKTTTKDVSVTKQIDITTTLAPTSTITSKIVSTVAPDGVVATAPAACGLRGVTQDGYFLYYLNGIPSTTVAGCIAACKANPNCLSSMFEQDGFCRLYRAPVVNVGRAGLGFTRFDDKDCPVPAEGGTGPGTQI